MLIGVAIRRTGSRSFSRQRGVSLIEVLVSVIVLSIGLLGTAAMQSIALRGGQSSLESSQAVIQTTSIFELMKANPAVRTNRTQAADYNTAAMVCTAEATGSRVQNERRDWINSIKATIGTPGDTTTCGQITGCPNCEVTVRWNDQRAGGGATRQVVTRSAL